MSIENPPGIIIRTEAQKAAFDNGFRIDEGMIDGWLRYSSASADGDIWIAATAPEGTWFLSISHVGAASEIGKTDLGIIPSRFTYECNSLFDLYALISKVYRLGVSLPDVPLKLFRTETSRLPQNTEVERLVVQRIGQNLFRSALLEYWNGRCPITSLSDPELLRASHIVPWAECETDEKRLDVYNGLLLSALWDAAFDKGLLSFSDSGIVIFSPKLSDEAKHALGGEYCKIDGLTTQHKANLKYHRRKFGLSEL